MKIIQASFYMLLCEITILTAYEIKCPHQSQWTKRAQKKCQKRETYHCLLDLNVNTTIEKCLKPNDIPSGFKSVVSGNLHVDKCSPGHFAPNPSWSNNTFECVYRKSICVGEGLIMYASGSHEQDATCQCDYTKGYKYVFEPEDPCFCRPRKEDCSCYLHTCPDGGILTQDYTCVLQNRRIVGNFNCNANGLSGNRTDERILRVNINTTVVPEMTRPFITMWTITFIAGVMCILFLTIYGYKLLTMQEKVNKKRKKILNSAVRNLSYFSLMEKQLKTKQCLILFGRPGSGKTTIGKYFLNIYKKSRYKTVYITKSNINMESFKRNRNYFIFVDCFFVYPLKNREFEPEKEEKFFEGLIKSWRSLQMRNKKAKIIITLERYPSNYNDVQDLNPSDYEFNLDLALYDKKDKELILKSQKDLLYLSQKSHNNKHSTENLLETLDIEDPIVGFPQIASSLLEHEDHITLGRKFVSQPPLVLLACIEKLREEGHVKKFCANMYCILVSILSESDIMLENIHSETKKLLETVYKERVAFDFEKMKEIVYSLSPFYLAIEENNEQSKTKVRFSKKEIKHAVMISFAKKHEHLARTKCDICDVIRFLRPRQYQPLRDELVFQGGCNVTQDELFADRIVEKIVNNTNVPKVVTALEDYTEMFHDIELLQLVERKMLTDTRINHKACLHFFNHLGKFATEIKQTKEHTLYVFNLSWMYICAKVKVQRFDSNLLPAIQYYPGFFNTIVDDYANTLLHFFVIWNNDDEGRIISDSLSTQSLAQHYCMLENKSKHLPLHFAAYLGRYDIFCKLKQIIRKASFFKEDFVDEIPEFKRLITSGQRHAEEMKLNSNLKLDVCFEKDLLPPNSFVFGNPDEFKLIAKLLENEKKAVQKK